MSGARRSQGGKSRREQLRERLQEMEKIVEERLARLGYELVDFRIGRAEGRLLVEVSIDCPGGVDVQTCQEVSGHVEAWFDAIDPIDVPYMLQVSSPGLDRPLKKRKDFERFAGRLARLKLAPDPGQRKGKRLIGRLRGVDDDATLIEVEGRVTRVPFDQIEEARLEYEWD